MVFQAGTNKIAPFGWEVALRAGQLLKDQLIFTMFLYEETQNVIQNRIISASFNGNTTEAGTLAHQAIVDLLPLLELTRPFVGFDSDNPSSIPAQDINFAGAFVTSMTVGITLCFNCFSHCSLDMYKYHRKKQPISGITDLTYYGPDPSNGNAQTLTIQTFSSTQMERWDIKWSQASNIIQTSSANTSFIMFIYEESFNIINRLLRQMSYDDATMDCHLIATKYIPDLIYLIEWTNSLYASLIQTNGMSLSYNTYFKATLQALLYYRTLNGPQLERNQYYDRNGDIQDFPDDVNPSPETLGFSDQMEFITSILANN